MSKAPGKRRFASGWTLAASIVAAGAAALAGVAALVTLRPNRI
jgi:hypothetical protein